MFLITRFANTASELTPELTINGLYNLNLSLKLPLLQPGWNSYGLHTPPSHSCPRTLASATERRLLSRDTFVFHECSFPFLRYDTRRAFYLMGSLLCAPVHVLLLLPNILSRNIVLCVRKDQGYLQMALWLRASPQTVY